MPARGATNRDLHEVHTLPQLVSYLKNELGWPVEADDFGDLDELTFDWGSEELGIDPQNAAKIDYIKQLRPLERGQPKGVFFVKFDTRQLPVVALRRVLSRLVVKKRTAASAAERPLWQMRDLVFISSFGETDERQLSFAYFQDNQDKKDLPTLKVLGWDNQDTPLHLDAVDTQLREHLSWPDRGATLDHWREGWSKAFRLRHREVIDTSKLLAVRLAELARAIRDRIHAVLAIETEDGPVTRLMNAFQEALVHDLDAEGFADMYAQTIAYGLLSARITNPEANTADGFAAQLPVINPFLKDLMETFLRVGGRKGKAGRGPAIDFDELGVSEVVELLDDPNTLMEAVVRDFGDKNPREDPVIHFYELFLKEYDAKKRMQRGVFYTPRPVVSYIVRSVDKLLRTEFGLADGLADTAVWGDMTRRHKGMRVPEGTSPDQPFVQILDPATGTGTFLVEVIDLIHKTLVDKWKTQGHDVNKIAILWNEYVPKHLLPRVYGYELLMAPYAIAHLKIGLKLYETGYSFASKQRVGIYLTNALEPASSLADVKAAGLFEALGREAQAVNEVKRKQRFTVVIGNPPYSNFGQLNKIPFILDLLADYKRGLAEKKLNLDDDFIKFFRLFQFLIDSAGCGLVGVITNNAFIDGITHRQMRRSLLGSFKQLRILDLHGSAKKKERAPDGRAEENVFDIQQGVSISLLSKCVGSSGPPLVTYSELWGSRDEKYRALSTADATSTQSTSLDPLAEMYFLAPKELGGANEFTRYVSLGAALKESISGVQSKKDSLFIGFTESEVAERVEAFLDPRRRSTDPSLKAILGPDDGWIVKKARGTTFDRECIRPIQMSPLDFRFIYYEPRLLGRARFDVMRHMLSQNIGLVFMRQSANQGEYDHILVVRTLVTDRVFYSANGAPFLGPLYQLDRGKSGIQASLLSGRVSNLVPELENAVARAVNRKPKASSSLRPEPTPEDILNYLYATLHSSGYRARYADLLRIDYPRVPLPGSPEVFRDLSRLGGELVGLHLLESARVRHANSTYIGPRNPEVTGVAWSDNTVWLDAAATKKGQPAKRGAIGFADVPEAVWNFHIGGYQICAKWLKDRKGRRLSKDDLSHYQKIVVALAETIRLRKEIEEVIEAHGGWPDAFQAKVTYAEAPSELALVAEPPEGYSPRDKRKPK